MRSARRTLAATALWGFGLVLQTGYTPGAAAGAAAEPVDTVDRLVARVIAAQGGREKLAAVHSRRETGSLSFGEGGGPLVVELARPARMHMELTLQGKTIVRTYDGNSGWQLDPLAGATEAAALAGDDLANISHEAAFDPPWIAPEPQGVRLALAGEGGVEGRKVYRLQVTFPDGDVDIYSFDAETFLKVQWEGTRRQAGKPVTFVTSFRDYRRVGDLSFPFHLDSSQKGQPPNQHIVLSAIDLNPPLADSRFSKPSPPPAPAPKAGQPSPPPPPAPKSGQE